MTEEDRACLHICAIWLATFITMAAIGYFCS